MTICLLAYLPASRVAILLSNVSLRHLDPSEGGNGRTDILQGIPPTSMRFCDASLGMGGRGILGGFMGMRRTVPSALDGATELAPTGDPMLLLCLWRALWKVPPLVPIVIMLVALFNCEGSSSIKFTKFFVELNELFIRSLLLLWPAPEDPPIVFPSDRSEEATENVLSVDADLQGACEIPSENRFKIFLKHIRITTRQQTKLDIRRSTFNATCLVYVCDGLYPFQRWRLTQCNHGYMFPIIRLIVNWVASGF